MKGLRITECTAQADSTQAAESASRYLHGGDCQRLEQTSDCDIRCARGTGEPQRKGMRVFPFEGAFMKEVAFHSFLT